MVKARTSEAPALYNSFAQESRVAPVVVTSSSSKIFMFSILEGCFALNTFARFFILSALVRLDCGGVFLFLTRILLHTGIPRRLESNPANASD